MTRIILATLSEHADTFRSKLLAFMDRLNWNIARAGTGNVAYPQSTLDRTAAEEAEADTETAQGAVADEVTAAGDVEDVLLVHLSLMGSILAIRLAALPHRNGKH